MTIPFDQVTPATWRALELITGTPDLLGKCLRLLEDNSTPERLGGSLSKRLAQELSMARMPAVQWDFVEQTLRRLSASLSFSPDASSWTDAAETAFRD